MPITVSGTSITFNDATVQTTASVGGFGGATTNAVSSSAITLTNTSSQYQVAQISSFTNSYVTLPNATTMSSAGSDPFVIENRSPYGANLELRNSAGTVVGYIPIGQIGTVQLVDKSTSAGRWNVELVNPQVFFNYDSSSITNTTSSPVSTGSYGIVGLSSTSFVRWWVVYSGLNTTNTSLILYTQAATISGSTITFGSTQSSTAISGLSSAGGAVVEQNCSVIRLSNTSFAALVGFATYDNFCVIAYAAGQRILTCTVSGTTVTFGTPSAASLPSITNYTPVGNSQVAASVARNGTICRLSDTSFALFYNDGVTPSYTWPYNYSGSMSCQIVTVSGTTQTIGTKVTLGTSTYSQVLSAVGLSSTAVFLCYGQATSTGGSSGRSKIAVASVSGTVPTFGSPVSCEAADVLCFNAATATPFVVDSAVAPSATQVVFNTGYSVGEATVSGTTPTFDVFAYTARLTPLFLSTSSKAYTGSSTKAYLSIGTGGFVTNTNGVNVLQTNLAVTNAIPWSPLGAQPTTSFVAYSTAASGNASSNTVILGTTT